MPPGATDATTSNTVIVPAQEALFADTRPSGPQPDRWIQAEAKAWAEGEGIPASAFQAMGVADEVLMRAGFEVTPTSSSTTRAGSGGRRSSGTRAPRIPLEEVDKAAQSLGKEWKLSDLAEQIERDPTTTRNYLKKLMEAGKVTEIGDDPNHDGRGRAAKLYSAA